MPGSSRPAYFASAPCRPGCPVAAQSVPLLRSPSRSSALRRARGVPRWRGLRTIAARSSCGCRTWTRDAKSKSCQVRLLIWIQPRRREIPGARPDGGGCGYPRTRYGCTLCQLPVCPVGQSTYDTYKYMYATDPDPEVVSSECTILPIFLPAARTSGAHQK